jgi:hypothetical protein
MGKVIPVILSSDVQVIVRPAGNVNGVEVPALILLNEVHRISELPEIATPPEIYTLKEEQLILEPKENPDCTNIVFHDIPLVL